VNAYSCKITSARKSVTLQSGFPKMNIDSVNFHDLNDRIVKAKDNNLLTVKEVLQTNNDVLVSGIIFPIRIKS